MPFLEPEPPWPPAEGSETFEWLKDWVRLRFDEVADCRSGPQQRIILITDCAPGFQHYESIETKICSYHDIVKTRGIIVDAFVDRVLDKTKQFHQLPLWTQWIDIVLHSNPMVSCDKDRYCGSTPSKESAPIGFRTNYTSTFLRLPPEVRNAIYEAVLAMDTVRDLPLGTHGLLGTHYAVPPALARTCREIRNELLPLFYSSRLFVIFLDTRGSFQKAISWLQSMGESNFALVRNIVLIGRANRSDLSDIMHDRYHMKRRFSEQKT